MAMYDARGRLGFPEPASLGWLGRRRGAHPGPRSLCLTELYCRGGHPLISRGNPRFDGRPGIALLCEGRRLAQVVYLSPFRNDRRKVFHHDFEPGEVLRVRCPVCREELPSLAPHDCTPGAAYVVLFLRGDADMRHVAAVCNAWGCPASLLRSGDEIVAEAQSLVLPARPRTAPPLIP